MRRAFVIGNGPSLNRIDIKKLATETTISFNRAYIAYEEWGFYPTYYMCIDGIVLENIKDDINHLIKTSPIEHFFLPDWIRPSIVESDKVTFIHLNPGQFIGTDINNLSVLGNAGACSVQILNMLGFRQIILVGVDCRYEESDLENVKIEHNPDDKVRRIVYKSSGNSDPNHFRIDYFGAGCEYGKPQQQNHFRNWQYLANSAPNFGIQIISSSPGSTLNGVFPYVEFESIFSVKPNKFSASCRYLFVSSNDTHVQWMYPLAQVLDESRFMVIAVRNEKADYYLTKLNEKFFVYQQGILSKIKPSVVVFGNDWGGPERQIVAEAKQLGIATVCIQEGCLDFADEHTNRMLHADYAFLQGPVMRKYLKKENNVFVTGNPKYDSLYEIPLPEKVTVMINSNFTYGIYEGVRDQWVRDVAESCKELDLDFFISQHPRDKGVFPPDYPLIKSDAFKMQQQLQNSSILVSRFSTVIYEAVAMGREAIYYNPHREPFRIFAQDDTGGIQIANNRSELVRAIHQAIENLDTNRENRNKFLTQHCYTLSHDAVVRCAACLRAVAQNNTEALSILSAVGEQRTGQVPGEGGREGPTVSVIMPCYNAAEYLAEAIKSVLTQSYRNFELVIINDGSTDNTEEMVLVFNDKRIRYFQQENRGLAATHNRGIEQSRGEYVIKLDADDMMTPDFISRHIQEFEKHPEADLIYCDDYLINDSAEPIRIIKRPEYSDEKSLIRDMFRCGFPVVPFRTCVRKSVFEKIGFFDESLSLGEDYDMMRRFVRHGLKIHHLRDALYLRRMTGDSLSRNFTGKKGECLFEILGRFVDAFTCSELFPDVAWEKIAPQRRQLRAKCLVAATYLSLGQTYINANSSSVYIQIAFKHAYSELNECLKVEPGNRQVRELLQKCELGMQKYGEQIQQAAL